MPSSGRSVTARGYWPRQVVDQSDPQFHKFPLPHVSRRFHPEQSTEDEATALGRIITFAPKFAEGNSESHDRPWIEFDSRSDLTASDAFLYTCGDTFQYE